MIRGTRQLRWSPERRGVHIAEGVSAQGKHALRLQGVTTWQTRSQWLAAKMGVEPPGPGLQVTGTEPPPLCQGLTLSPRPWFCVSLVSQQNIHSKYSDLSQLSQCFKIGSIGEATPQGRECPQDQQRQEEKPAREGTSSTQLQLASRMPSPPSPHGEQGRFPQSREHVGYSIAMGEMHRPSIGKPCVRWGKYKPPSRRPRFMCPFGV